MKVFEVVFYHRSNPKQKRRALERVESVGDLLRCWEWAYPKRVITLVYEVVWTSGGLGVSLRDYKEEGKK